MALSKKTKRVIEVGLANRMAAEELIEAVEASGVVGAAVTDISGTPLAGVDGTGDNAAPLAGTEARLKAIEDKINELLESLRDSSKIAQ